MQVLIIEDEFNLADAIANRLRKEKYVVDICVDGEEGYCQALTNVYDLIILDIMLPTMNGFEILSKIKANNINSKVIILSARSSLEDKMEGFDTGVNDYVSKPFHMDELVARVNVWLRNNVDKNKLLFGDLELNLLKSEIRSVKNNETVELVCKEYQLLEYFMSNPNQILSKEQIYDRIWGLDSERESNNLEVYLSFIRRKLKAIDSDVLIKSVRGLGYKMEVSNERVKK